MRFEVAGGSVRGTRHRHQDVNNQDASHWERRGEVLVAVVADGCSSSPHSEVGAKLGVRIVTEAAYRELAERPDLFREDPQRFLDYVQARLFGALRPTLASMGAIDRDGLYDYLLFTLVLAVVTPERTLIAAGGDGVAALNGTIRIRESEANRPEYPVYGLLGDPEPMPLYSLDILWSTPTGELDTLLLGTDGVAELIAAEEAALPGRKEYAGPLAQFWSEDRYFRNPDALRRRLALINREHRLPDWQAQTIRTEPGLLPDDTTLVVIRRTGEEG